MRPTRQREQHRSSGRILPERISWILRQAERLENVLKGESLLLHFRRALWSTSLMMWSEFLQIAFIKDMTWNAVRHFTIIRK